jgi:hypothetical protein
MTEPKRPSPGPPELPVVAPLRSERLLKVFLTIASVSAAIAVVAMAYAYSAKSTADDANTAKAGGVQPGREALHAGRVGRHHPDGHTQGRVTGFGGRGADRCPGRHRTTRPEPDEKPGDRRRSGGLHQQPNAVPGAGQVVATGRGRAGLLQQPRQLRRHARVERRPWIPWRLGISWCVRCAWVWPDRRANRGSVGRQLRRVMRRRERRHRGYWIDWSRHRFRRLHRARHRPARHPLRRRHRSDRALRRRHHPCPHLERSTVLMTARATATLDRGIDYSGARPAPAATYKAGGRRYSAGAGNTQQATQWKLCGVHEIADAVAAGLDFIANSEWYESRITEGAAAGAGRRRGGPEVLEVPRPGQGRVDLRVVGRRTRVEIEVGRPPTPTSGVQGRARRLLPRRRYAGTPYLRHALKPRR